MKHKLINLLCLALLTPVAQAGTWYVAPKSVNTETGDQDKPFTKIQTALNIAQPGDIVSLAPGHYIEDIKTIRHGLETKPITIQGSKDAIIHGSGKKSHVFDLNHNHHVLKGFTLDGLYGDPTQQSSYRNKLLYVTSKIPKTGVKGLKIMHMTFRNAGGECLRLRNFTQRSEIAYSQFNRCGVYGFQFASGNLKNGEAIYIGTSSTQWADGRNPTADPDQSNHNWVHHNEFNTQGNECIDVKEGATQNVIEYNRCTGQLDAKSAGIDIRGDGNIVRYNETFNNIGSGIRIGGHTVEGHQYGVNNDIYDNRIYNNQAYGIKLVTEPQNSVTGNCIQNNGKKPISGKQWHNKKFNNKNQPCLNS